MKRILRRFLSTLSVRRSIIDRYYVVTILHWCSSWYLRRFSNLDARYFRWLYLLEQTRHLEGDIVELGVGPGRFLVYCTTWLKATGSPKRYWGYDTFSGFPSIIHDKDLEGLTPKRLKKFRPGTYAFYNFSRIGKLVKRLGANGNVKLIKGDFTKTLKEIRPDRISFLYMDCDLYESYKAGLERLYDCVVPGGVILFDEYEEVKVWPGAGRAVDEFFASKPEKPTKLPFSPSHYVIRGTDATP